MTDLLRPRPLLTALALAASAALCACSGSDPYEVEGESSMVEVGEGASLFDEQRAAAARDAAAQDAAAQVAGAGTGAAATDAATGDGAAAAFDPTVAGNLSVGGVDPALAAKLKADPSAQAGDSIENLVTFRQLSLAGVDLDALLDYLFSDDEEKAARFEFPAGIQALSGKQAAVVGYMIPLEYKPKTDDIVIFMLVRDLMSCCFGQVPRPDEWIYVEMAGDAVSKLYPYIPITVRGELHVGKLEDEFGFSSGVYSLKATSVEEFKIK